MKLKYIIVETELNEVAIVFPGLMTHEQVARGHEVVSAGFVYFPDGYSEHCSVLGESSSLGLKCREIDAIIIQKQYFKASYC